MPRLAFTGRRPPLHLDPPEHTPYRRALNPYFTPAKMAAIEPALRRIVGDLLDPLVAAGGGDFCAEFTHRLPGYVFAEFFNLTPELGMAIREATREFVNAVQRFEAESVKRTSLALYDIARTIIAMRQAEPLDPADDPTTGLLAARVDGEPLPEDMLLGTIRQFIVVGMVAPCVFIGSMVVHLAENPELQAQLRGRSEPDPGRGRGVPPPADAVPRLRPHADPRRRDRRAADPQGRARRARLRLGEPRRVGLPRARASSCSTARTSAATSPSAPARTAARARRSRR